MIIVLVEDFCPGRMSIKEGEEEVLN